MPPLPEHEGPSVNEPARLECVSLGEDEYGIPHNEVYFIKGEKQEKVAECLACQEISRESFQSFEIPETAISACGGWWAGGGDYFYAIQGKGGVLEVYFGWQDEGQEDDGFHWELKVTSSN